MKFDTNIADKIEKYINNMLSEEETKSFQKQINKSDELKEFIELYKQLDSLGEDNNWVLQNLDNNNIKDILNQYHNEATQDFSNKIRKTQKRYNQNKQATRKIGYKIALYGGIAAVIIFLISLNFTNKTDLNSLYKNYNSWDELQSYDIKGDEKGSLKNKIEDSFKKENYNQVIVLSNEYFSTATNQDVNILIYLGVSQLEIGAYDNALQSFNKLSKKKDFLDYHKAYWYKSLVFLKLNNKEAAIKALKEVTKNEYNFRYEEAKKILKIIE